VFAAQHERVQALVHGAIASGAVTPENLELAAQLLTGHTAANVVAALLGQLGNRIREPHAVTRLPMPPSARERQHDARPHLRREPDGRDDSPRGGADAGSADVVHEARPRGGDGGRFVIFRINWGTADGADPRRILAHVCRRGQVDNHMVGAIDIGQASSTFAIATDVAREFAQRVQRRDRRDPHLVIHPAEGAPPRPAKRPHRVPQIWSRHSKRPPDG
jgi:ATP-dependent RNA helicase DeaD